MTVTSLNQSGIPDDQENPQAPSQIIERSQSLNPVSVNIQTESSLRALPQPIRHTKTQCPRSQPQNIHRFAEADFYISRRKSETIFNLLILLAIVGLGIFVYFTAFTKEQIEGREARERQEIERYKREPQYEHFNN